MIENNNIEISCENNETLFDRLEKESITIILTDPPYKYLKNQKLDVDFDEKIFFDNCNRVLKKGGFIILFGRGISFYRWNTILDKLGFIFKEEIVWDKSMNTSPLMNISRVHETISIFCKGNNSINKNFVPYIESKAKSFEAISQDLKRIKSAIGNTESLNQINNYINNEILEYTTKSKRTNVVSISSDIENRDRGLMTYLSIDRGMIEKTIIKNVRENYTSIHPTQKPTRLIERLLLLVKKTESDIVLDPFGGSFSTMEAVYNLGLKGISCELDSKYFELSKKRIDDITKQKKMAF